MSTVWIECSAWASRRGGPAPAARRRGRCRFPFLGSLKELGLPTFLIAETPFGSNRLAQWGEDFLADGILHLRQVEVGETEVQLRLRCVKMRWMNHDKNALALHHDGEKFFVSHVISKKK